MNNAGGLHWPELKGLIDTVLIVVQGWCIIQDYQTLKHQTSIEYWYTLVRTVQRILKNQKCFQLKEIK